MKKHIFAALLCATIAPPALANDVIAQIPVDTSFAAGDFQWTNGKKGYTYRIKLVNYNGRLALCGVGTYRDTQLREPASRMLRGGTLMVDGQVRVSNFMFFNRVNRVRQLDSASANCADAGPLPKNPDSIKFELGNGTWRN